MIEYLNRQTFAGYGRILRDRLPNRGFPQEDGWTETICRCTSGETYFRTCSDKVYLDFEQGMTVLIVRQNDQTTSFYLDKPVCLAPNTEFALVPYQQECAVRMSCRAASVMKQTQRLNTVENLKIGDRLRLGEIYTLFYREEESGFLFKGESHSMYELTYVDRGQLHCVVDGNGYSLKQGQLMFFSPLQWHMQYADLESPVRFLTIAFDLESDLSLALHDRVFDLSTEEAAFLKSILRETERNDVYSGDAIRCDLKLLMLSLLRDTSGRKKRLKTPAAVHNENLIIGRTLQYIADHVYDRLSVELVAKEAGVSASHMTALFRRQMNISPGEYIRRVKLEESKSLIREGKHNLSQIAALLNYSTIHHFSRQFKEHFGISPSEYAKTLQDEA